MQRETVRVEFLGCSLTAWGGNDGKGESVWLNVIYFAEFLRGEDGDCAFCQGDPGAERKCTDCGGGYVEFIRGGATWRYVPHTCGKPMPLIAREFMAHPQSFESCPCCKGRPS